MATLAAACGPAGPVGPSAAARRRAPSIGESAYRRPPAIVGVQALGGGRLRLEGHADPGVKVRLATPSGQAVFVKADGSGAWSLVPPASRSLHLYGLSMMEGGRDIQAEGYVAVAPGVAAQLRDGAGAVVFAPEPTARLAIRALDLDRKGAAVVSGRAPPGASVVLRVDGRASGQAVAAASGDFAFDLGEPLAPRAHRIEVAANGLTARVEADATPAAIPALGPFAADPAGSGWRIVWTPPGGGLQTSFVFGGPEGGA